MSQVMKNSFPSRMDADIGMSWQVADSMIDRISEELRELADQVEDPELKRQFFKKLAEL